MILRKILSFNLDELNGFKENIHLFIIIFLGENMEILSNMGEQEKIATYSPLDDLLEGGIDKKSITQIYGPPGSGKTNISLNVAVHLAREDKKVVYVDTEGGISIDRIKQLAKDDFEKVAKNIIVFQPNNFEEQEEDLGMVSQFVSKHDDVELIVLDSAVALFRIEESKSRANILGQQMGLLASLAKNYNLAVLVTNQIYASFDETIDENAPVGGTILQYWCKTILELKREELSTQRIAVLRRHRSIEENVAVHFSITNNGIE